MSDELEEFTEEAQESAEAVLGEVFTFRGREINGIFSEIEFAEEVQAAGFADTAELQVTCRRKHLFEDPGKVPSTGRRITRKKTGKEYRITRWIDDGPGLVSMELTGTAEAGT